MRLGGTERRRVSGTSPFEELAGYSRAVRVGNIIEVAGTTALGKSGVMGQGDAFAQAQYALKVIEQALQELGAGMEDVTRTRIYITNIENLEAVSRAHRGVFDAIRPASTLVQVAALAQPELLVEIEAQAVVQMPQRVLYNN